MSCDNVRIVSRLYEAWNREDWNAALREAAPDFEATFQRGPSAGTHRGRERVRSLLSEQRAAFDAWHIEPSAFFRRGDLVVAFVTSRIRPKGTTQEIVLNNGHIWTISEGAIVSLVGFPDPKEALEAAGLTEEAMVEPDRSRAEEQLPE